VSAVKPCDLAKIRAFAEFHASHNSVHIGKQLSDMAAEIEALRFAAAELVAACRANVHRDAGLALAEALAALLLPVEKGTDDAE